MIVLLSFTWMFFWYWMWVSLLFGSAFVLALFFFFKQKTAYEMRISDWSSDVCSSDLILCPSALCTEPPNAPHHRMIVIFEVEHRAVYTLVSIAPGAGGSQRRDINQILGKQFRPGIEFQIIKIPRLLMQELHQFVVHRRTNRQALARPTPFGCDGDLRLICHFPLALLT